MRRAHYFLISLCTYICCKHIHIWSVCKASCPFGQAAWGTSELWEWNEVDEIFSLVDFYYHKIIGVQSIQCFRERVCYHLIWMFMIDCLKWRLTSWSVLKQLTNRLCVTTSLILWAHLSECLRVHTLCCRHHGMGVFI